MTTATRKAPPRPTTPYRRSDPFTTDSARIVDPNFDERALDRDAQAYLPKVKAVFGRLGEIRFKKYFGEDGGWRVGFKSWFGFHTRGQGATAAEAVRRMVRQHDDPCPHWDSHVPGSYTHPFTKFDTRICKECHPPKEPACSNA